MGLFDDVKQNMELAPVTEKKPGKQTEAQAIMDNARYKPVEKLILLSEKYQLMLLNQVNWAGEPATAKELSDYAKELRFINSDLLPYQSAKAQVKDVNEPRDITSDNKAEEEDNDRPLTTKDLAEAKRDMKAGLDDRI